MKLIIAAVFVAIVSLASSSHGAATSISSISNINFATAVKMFYTAIQRIMPCGYAPYHLPIMAPFTLDQYSVDVQNDFYGINGSVANIVVTGMDKFMILDSSIDAKTQRTSFDLIQPEVQILAEADLHAWVMIAGHKMKSAFKGTINIKILDSRIVGGVTIGLNPFNSQGVQFSDFQVNTYLGDILFNNWNKHHDIALNNFLNRWAREATLMFFEEIQPHISDYYTAMMPLNKLLANVSMSDIINYLVQQSMLMTEAANSCVRS